MAERKLQEKIRRMAMRQKATLLVHNYQVSAIQEIADFIGDSLELCRRAQDTEAETIIFCGVDFMAETASILNPDRTVIIPSKEARCPMAAMLPRRVLLETRREHPGVPAVVYVNTLAEAKAEADVTCTSANADKIIRKLGVDEVLFGPDRNLAYYAQKRTPGIDVIPMPEDGFCHVHRSMGKGEEILELKRTNPDSEIIVHPECEAELQNLADQVLSTGGIYRQCRDSDSRTFIIGTEVEMLERLRREIPKNTYIPARPRAECAAMKRITLENTYKALLDKKPVVKVPKKIAEKAKEPIELMLEMSR